MTTEENRNLPVKRDAIVEIMDRAQQGDTSTLPALRTMLVGNSEVAEYCGNLVNRVQRKLLDQFIGADNLLMREAILRKMELLLAELAGPNPSPVERLLAERIVACWLHVHLLELGAAGTFNGGTFEQGTFYQRCIDRAHRRYLSALKTLAMVRKLAVPVLQVNIAAQQQVNVAEQQIVGNVD